MRNKCRCGATIYMENKGKKPNIAIRNLNVTYNEGKTSEVKALEGINLEVFPREYLILFGPSGCGKSTLLYSIAGFQKPTSGSVEIDGQAIHNLAKLEKAEFHRRKIGIIFQAFYLIDSLPVIDNICLPKIFTEEDKEERKKTGLGLLKRFGIDEQAEKFTIELSGGQKQRAAIARSLVNNPEIILADEPVGNLDSKSAHNVMTILRELNEVDKKTVILVTHDPAHLPYGDRVAYMKDGKIVKIEEVFDKKIPELKAESDWEIIKKKDGEEIVKVKKEAGEEIYKINRQAGEEVIRVKAGSEWKVVKKGYISPEIRMLMEAFKNFSIAQLGVLITPFKAQQLFSHIFFNMPEEQMEEAKKRLQNLLFSKTTVDDFENALDTESEKGGVGWDKRSARWFAGGVKRILDQSAKIDLSNVEASAVQVGKYMTDTFKLKIDAELEKRFTKTIRERLENKISIANVRRALDDPANEGGIGLNKKTAEKISRELEILLLMRFLS